MTGTALSPPARAKFADPDRTATGEPRARVSLHALETLWVNTGSLCNISCATCYIDSSPRNDALAYIGADEVAAYLAEIAELGLPTRLVGLTGGEPFLNPDILPILTAILAAGHDALVLTNAMRPMMRHAGALAGLAARYGARLRLRVSLDHYTAAGHDAERGAGSFARTLEGLRWAAGAGIALDVASRLLGSEGEAELRAGFARLFAAEDLPVDAADPLGLVIFPQMDATADVPEITDRCWGILGKSPREVMCASARMVVKRRGAARPAVLACTLLAYDPRFELGTRLSEAMGPVALAHPHCATFCVLGGASCGAPRGEA
ncbi:MAG: radical SAM protein [Alphaproteobacteria bacterium]|nr:radical SAM protein [Alphaproteobacteria bacterium]